jgi:hypothetical protein
VTTDGTGSYRIPDLSGAMNLRYSREGFVATGRTVDMTQDTFLNVSLARGDPPPGPDPTFILSGVVAELQGSTAPIAGALVEVLTGEREGDTATTNGTGRYTLDGLSGEVTIRASGNGWTPSEETVELAEDQTLDFTLLPLATLSMCLDLDDEEVHITNDDRDKELVLTDWILREVSRSNAFTFVEDISCRGSMSGFTLAPGATVIITSGDSPKHSPPTHIAGWCEDVWDNNGDTARLLNSKGDLVVKAVGSFDSCGS